MFVLLKFWKSGNYGVVGYETANRAVAAFEACKKDGSFMKAMYLMTADGPQLKWEAE